MSQPGEGGPANGDVGERRWPMAVAVLAATLMRLGLPPPYRSHWPCAAVEVLLLAALIIGDPGRIDRTSPVLRRLTTVLLAVIIVDNTFSIVELVRSVITGQPQISAATLLAVGGVIWATNVIAFSLCYWQFDRDGPAARAVGTSSGAAFVFPEEALPGNVPRGWGPQYADYLYLAFTNATAFSPTDTMPVRTWAKLTMMVEAATSLVIGLLVISRAINILPS
jgi:uncharacterized membrane protein